MKGGANYCAEHLQANDYYEKGCKVEGVGLVLACKVILVKAGESVVPRAFEKLRHNEHATLLDPDGAPLQITERMHGDTVDGQPDRRFTISRSLHRRRSPWLRNRGNGGGAGLASGGGLSRWSRRWSNGRLYRMNRGGNIELDPSGTFCVAHHADDANRNL